MINSVNYLRIAPYVDHLVILCGYNFSNKTLKDIIHNVKVKKISFYCQNNRTISSFKDYVSLEKSNNPYCKECDYIFYNYEDFKKIKNKNEKVGLFFDSLANESALLDLCGINLIFLCGTIKNSPSLVFNIWEKYKVFTDSVYISSFLPSGKENCLLWEKSKNNIELSVVLPVYNVSKYLNKCISTVTSWEADYIEFIFVDDGSTDNSASIIREAMKKDKRIKLIQKENGGCASARQLGLENAQGKYVGFIDPDDYIDSAMFQKLLAKAMVGSYEISYCGYSEEYDDGTRKEIPDALAEPYVSGTTDKTDILNLCCFARVAIWRAIYSTNMIRKANIHFYTDLKRFDDLAFMFETFSVAKSVVATPEHLYFYRIGRPGQDVSSNDDRLYVHFEIFKHLNDYVLTRGNDDIMERLQIVKLHTHQYALKKIIPQLFDEYLDKAKTDVLSLFSLKESILIFDYYNINKEEIDLFISVAKNNASKAKKLLKD